MNKTFFCFLMALGLVCLCACDGPDPVPDSNSTPVPRQDVSSSLGETDKLTVASILGNDVAALLACDQDGVCSLDFSGESFSLSADPLSDFDGSKMFSRFLGVPLTTSFTLAGKPSAPGNDNEIDLSALLPDRLNGGSLSQSYTFGFNGFPNSLTELQGVGLSDDSVFEVTVSIANPCFTAGTIRPTFTVDLSSLFGVRGAENGLLTFDVELTPENRYSTVKTFHPESFTVDAGKFNATTKSLSSNLYISGKVTATHEGLRTTRQRLSSASAPFKLNIRLVLKKVTIDRFTGKFKFNVKDASGAVDLSALGTKTLANGQTLESLGFDPAAGKLFLDVESLFPLEADAKVAVTARRQGWAAGSVKDLPLVIPALTEGGAAKVRHDLSQSGNLSPVLKRVASEMVFSVGAKMRDDVATFRVGEPAKATFVPSVSIPLCFGAGLDFSSEERLALPQQVVAALKDGTLTLSGTIANGFPVSLTTVIVLVDAAGAAVSEPVSLACPADSHTPVQQLVKVLQGASLDDARSVLVKYTVKGVDGSRPFKVTDAIQTSLDAKIVYSN